MTVITPPPPCVGLHAKLVCEVDSLGQRTCRCDACGVILWTVKPQRKKMSKAAGRAAKHKGAMS